MLNYGTIDEINLKKTACFHKIPEQYLRTLNLNHFNEQEHLREVLELVKKWNDYFTPIRENSADFGLSGINQEV